MTAGGLVSALRGVQQQSFEALWVGWPGVNVDAGKDQHSLTNALRQQHYVPVYLNPSLVGLFLLLALPVAPHICDMSGMSHIHSSGINLPLCLVSTFMRVHFEPSCGFVNAGWHRQTPAKCLQRCFLLLWPLSDSPISQTYE